MIGVWGNVGRMDGVDREAIIPRRLQRGGEDLETRQQQHAALHTPDSFRLQKHVVFSVLQSLTAALHWKPFGTQ